MTLPPCVYPNPDGPSGCSCRPLPPQMRRQWTGHPFPGYELNESHDPPNLHGTQSYTNTQNALFPQTLYNDPHSPNGPNPPFQTHLYRPPPNAIPPVTQGVPSLSNCRKRKNSATGRGGARTRQWQPASVITAPTSAICGVGHSASIESIPPSSNLPDNDPPPSSPLGPFQLDKWIKLMIRCVLVSIFL